MQDAAILGGTANVRERDIGSFVADAQKAFIKGVKLPSGYWSAWGGQFEHLQNAATRRKVVVPASLAICPAVPNVQ